MTEEEYRTALCAKGYASPVEKTWEPGRLNDTHTHDVALFLYITAGEMTVTQGGERTLCRPGDSVEVPGGVDHVEEVGPPGVTFLVAKK